MSINDRVKSAVLATTLVLLLWMIPTTSLAASVVGGAGVVKMVNVERRTLVVRDRLLRMGPRSIVLNAAGRRIDFADLADHYGEGIAYVATRVGSSYTIRKLELIGDDAEEE